MPAFKPLSERYEITEDGCWMWTGGTDKDGYGLFRINVRDFRAHRYFYEFWHSTRIPEGMVIDHLCNRRRCVNPAHMKVTTNKENVLRSSRGPTAINARKTECIHGHPLSGDNLRISPKGHRSCKTCAQLWDKARQDRQYAEYYTKYNALLDR